MKHTLTLTRAGDTEALYRNDTTDIKVYVIYISWTMKQVKPLPDYHTSIMSIIEQKMPLILSFQARTSEQITLTPTLNQTWRLSVTAGVDNQDG